MNTDQMRYLVISTYRDCDYIPERGLADMDRATTIRDIRSGALNDVSHVIEFNIAEGVIFDRTEDILTEASKPEAPLAGQDLLDWRTDHERALRREADEPDDGRD